MNNNLDHLPLELLQLIVTKTSGLNDLYQCAIISKLFYTVTKPILWHSPWNPNNCQSVTTQVLNHLLRAKYHPHQSDPTPFGHYIRKLQFKTIDSVAKILELLAQTPLVEDLCLKCVEQLTDHDMDQVAQLCPQLNKLELIGLTLKDRSLESIGRHCPHLCELTLAYCSFLTPKSLLALNDNSLEYLTITGDNGWKLNDPVYLGRFHRLTYLNLSTGRTDTGGNMVCDFIPGQGIMLPLLKELSISCVGNHDSPMNDSLLVPFIKSHPHLERIHLRHCRIDKMTLIALTKYLCNLQYLDLDHSRGIDASALRSLTKDCGRLTFISVDGSNLTRRRFPESWQRIGRLKELDQDAINRIRNTSQHSLGRR